MAYPDGARIGTSTSVSQSMRLKKININFLLGNFQRKTADPGSSYSY